MSNSVNDAKLRKKAVQKAESPESMERTITR